MGINVQGNGPQRQQGPQGRQGGPQGGPQGHQGGPQGPQGGPQGFQGGPQGGPQGFQGGPQGFQGGPQGQNGFGPNGQNMNSGSLFGFGPNSNMQSGDMDPDTFAQNYADQNGLSLDEARQQLQSQYGEPDQQNGMQGNQTGSVDDLIQDLYGTVNNSDLQNYDPDTIAQQYATKYNISLEEALEALAELYGDPEQQ